MTINKTFIFVAAITLLSCSESEGEIREDKSKKIVLTQRDSLLKSNPQINLAPPSYYTGINFIIDSTDTLYFHNKSENARINFPVPEIPPLVDLKSNDLTIVTSKNLGPFIDSLSENTHRKIVMIASTIDSVNMPVLHTLEKYLTNEKGFYRILRPATQEEKKALVIKSNKTKTPLH